MSFSRPTLPALVDQIQQDFVQELDPDDGALLRRSIANVYARVFAGAAHLLHGHLAFLADQLFPDKSEAEFLARQAGLFGLSKDAPDYARAAGGATGVNGSVIPAGSLLVGPSGAEYQTDADQTISSGVATVNVTALLAGSASSLDVGLTLSFESPISGVDGSVTIATISQDGSDQETDDEFRVRLLERMAEPPQGGTVADYIAWAKTVTGVTRVFVVPLGLGPGTVLVRFTRDDDPSPIPDSGEVAAVQAALNALAPAHATVTAIAPIDAPIAFNLSITPDTVDNRNAVVAGLQDLLLRRVTPGGITLLSSLLTSIGATAGLTDFTLHSPSADVNPGAGGLPSLGSFTWV